MSAIQLSAGEIDRLPLLRRIALRRPITLFLVLVFGLGVPLMFLPLLAERGVIPGGSVPGMVGLNTERAAALLLVLLALLPAALIVSTLEGGRPAVRALLGRALIWRFGAGWWAAILLALPLTTIALSLLLGDAFRPPTAAAIGAELAGFAFGFLLVNLWEEISWAGFLQTRLERRHHLYLAAFLTAIPFAAIHMPLQVINGMTSPSALGIHFALLMVLAFVFRSLVGLVMRGAANSLLAVGLLHITFNRSNNNDGIAAKLLDGPHRQVAALAATLLLTVVLGLLLKNRAGPTERARLDARTGEGAAAAAPPSGQRLG
jgi:membrane protease YdiL (CAAX protease family)